MGLNLAVVLSICCCLRPSLPPTQECGSIRTDHPVSYHGAHKPNGVNLDPKPQNVDQGTRSPSDVLSEQAPNHQTTAPKMIDPEKVEDDNPPASSRAPAGVNGLFNGASNFVLNQPVVTYNNEAKDKVLQWLAKFTMSSAEFDARGHVPGCHPGTRIKILELLQHQVGDSENICRMVWVRGPAGVGKSAILQSLAERLSETSSLGATLFFSRPNGRHDPDFVIPTLAYQLAIRIPLYKEYIQQIMINNPKLLEKDVERQFRALIVEPFTQLRLTVEGDRWVILLDGLDECEGEDAQILFVKLISRFTRQHPSAPLVWVITSRPEAHLQGVFNSEGVRGSFEGHEVLTNSDDACRDVEEFLRAKFMEIKQRYEELMPIGAPWPAERDITRISMTSSGLFALATTIVHYVGDSDAGDPISQLATVLSVTKGLEPGSLSTLYTLYSAILATVPKTMSSTAKLLLSFYTSITDNLSSLANTDGYIEDYPLVLSATIFGLQQHVVYGALRKLHSVIRVPPLSDSGHRGITFYHASFSDYLKTREDYTFDVGMMKKFWWGWFAILHKGGSAAYQNEVSKRHPAPPIPLSWDVNLADRILNLLRFRGMRYVLHYLSPRCYATCALTHWRLDAKEIQDVLEGIDFSALFFQEFGELEMLQYIYELFRWFISAVPLEIPQSDVLKKISIRELDLTCVSEARSSHEVAWSYTNDDGTVNFPSESYKLYEPQYQYQHRVGWPTNPDESLVSKLEKLQGENSMVDVVMVGKRPSKSCVLIRTRPTNEEHGLFYFVPYCG